MSKTFTNAIIREIGRNFGKSISNSILKDSHSTPIRGVVAKGSRNNKYKNKLEKICKTWSIKGAKATFNVAQNIHLAFFELVDEAKEDNNIDLNEIHYLLLNFELAHNENIKIHRALIDLESKDLANKVDKLDDELFLFFKDLNEAFVLPKKPSGLFNNKKKKNWEYAKQLKDNLEKIEN